MQYKRIIFIITAILLVCAISFYLYNIGFFKSPAGGDPVLEGGITAAEDSRENEEQPFSGTCSNETNFEEAANIVEAVETVQLKVLNNTLEYDFESFLIIGDKSEPLLRISYYNDGSSTVKDFEKDLIPELEHTYIPENKEDNENITIYLNPIYARAYFVFRDKAGSDDYVKTTLYSYNLKDGSIKNIFSDIGKFTDVFFTKNFKYAGFSYFDNPSSSVFQETTIFQVLNCEVDEFIVRGSRNKDGVVIGKNLDAKSLYHFIFLQWQSNTIAKLGMAKNFSKDGVSADFSKKEDVYYDIEKNAFVNSDGSIPDIKEGSTKQDTTNETPLKEEDTKNPEIEDKEGQAESESDTVKLLKEFYVYLLSENDYNKAMGLLDNTFRLRMKILSQIGISELSKNDIDADEATIYANILRKTSIDRVVREEASNEASKIYYYQAFAMDSENKVVQPLVAHMKKVNKVWKITLIEDGE